MHKKRLTLGAGLVIALLFLTGCVRTTKNGQPYGMVYDYLARPMQHLMEWLAHYFHGSIGWSIVIIVIVVRLVLLPVMMSQMKKSTMMQERMAMLQPQLRALQERQKNAKTPEEQAALGQEMMAFYKDNNISLTGGIGCLPLIIQLPVFSALYTAIRYSPDLAHATFFGVQLGHRSALIAILAFLTYLAQGWLSMVGLPEEQKKQMKAALLMSPVMILFVSWTASAGLGIYFFIGGLFAILQTWLVNAYRPRIRRQIRAEAAKNPAPARPVGPVQESEQPTPAPSALKAPTTPKPTPTAPKKNRNAGKQHHHE